MDATNVDLKGFTEHFYRKVCGASLQPVLDTLVYVRHETDVWLEITNLLIPDANDDPSEVEAMCRWIVEHLGPDVPVHFTAFHPDYKMRDRPRTPIATLLSARRIGLEAGLRYVYTGNVHNPEGDTTWCPGCGEPALTRLGYVVTDQRLRDGCCQTCGERIPGRFEAQPGSWGSRRLPVRLADFA